MSKFTISLFNWFRLTAGLRKRGNGIRESGAFLLSKRQSNYVCCIAFYDQFDATVSESGIIEFKGANAFYQFLAKENLQVIADIHTHPSKDTGQSNSDKEHPMIRIKGHIAIIAPSYAMKYTLMPSDCSFYRYENAFNWEKLSCSILKITML